jgi:hypothetical protein
MALYAREMVMSRSIVTPKIPFRGGLKPLFFWGDHARSERNKPATTSQNMMIPEYNVHQ